MKILNKKALNKTWCFSALLLLLTIPFFSTGHSISRQDLPPHEWKLQNGETIQGYFLYTKGNTLFIQQRDNSIAYIAIDVLGVEDRKMVEDHDAKIARLNGAKPIVHAERKQSHLPALVLVVFVLLTTVYLLWKIGKRYTIVLSLVALAAVGFSFRTGVPPLIRSITDPTTVDSAFAPFVPNVVTSWDSAYFYVESLGIPTTHSMMTGITSWQQQVPIPQCYTGTNHWLIPLNPVISTSPIPVDSIHFTRGAIALAVNGIPIFNPHTNTGVDALLDGQLDNWGGHSGRADDYHYHIAPLHLYAYTSATLPIAYGLDGFAVFGSVEPDGTPMQTLDANHGHFWTNGIYHYHGTSSAPYMIARMAGVVTEDTTHQLVPQPRARPVRPSLTPLSGAVITAFSSTGSNGYVLTYALGGQNYQVDYNWTSTGVYTYNYINPSGTTTNTYNGFVPCQLNPSSSINALSQEMAEVFPVPTSDELYIKLNTSLHPADITSMRLFSITGNEVRTIEGYQDLIPTGGEAAGVYTLVIQTTTGSLVKKVVVRR
jgi:hypothetical protein